MQALFAFNIAYSATYALIEECPDFGKNAQIINDPVFEEVVIKVLNKHEVILIVLTSLLQ